MRIAFVADSLDGDIGGGVISARRFVERLSQNHDVTVIGTSARGLPCVQMKPIYLPSRRYLDMHFFLAWPQRDKIRMAIAHADVVHLQFPFFLSFAALAEAKRLGKPVVAAMHVQPENVLYNCGIRWQWLNAAMYRMWVNKYYNLADAVVCPTEFAAEKLRSYGLTVPTHIVSNGASPDIKRGTYTRAPGDEGYFVIASVGRYAWEKRQDVLIHAVQKSRYRERIKLVIAGCGPREKELRRLASKLPVPAEMGYLSNARLQQALNTADLFVHCSEVELEGMSVLDAMNVGLPALIAQSSESAASRFALDERFAFPAGDSDMLAARIDALISNPVYLRDGRWHSRLTAQRFDLGENVAKLRELYLEAA